MRRILQQLGASEALGLLLVAASLLLGACEADLEDGVGPLVPVPNLVGSAVRQDLPAGGLDVELRDARSAAGLMATRTETDGAYGFADTPAGSLEVKISGGLPGDFDSVSWVFEMTDPEATLVLPALDIHAYGAETLAPADGAQLPPPNPILYVPFRWVLPEQDVSWARVYVYDEDGDPVWTSAKNPTDQVNWNGYGNEGDYEGNLVPAGHYSWRIKMEFHDGLEARLDPREIDFLANAPRRKD